MKLSVALAVYNEEKNIGECLATVLGWADELVVVDGGSSDKTVEIAKSFGATVIQTTNPPIFHINKQKALDACVNMWILQLDADERITPELKKEIEEVLAHESSVRGYYIPRRNYFWGHWMKKGGQYPDSVIRLVKKDSASFPAKSVHEQIHIEGAVGHLTSPMDHISYRTKEDYWRKSDRYTTLTAAELSSKHVPKNIWSFFYYSLVKPVQIFISLFVIHKGFMDGWYGFLFAYWSSLHYKTAYKKYIQKASP
jgi:glycosyltransferase involved in cell wall biosynthesis